MYYTATEKALRCLLLAILLPACLFLFYEFVGICIVRYQGADHLLLVSDVAIH